VEGRKRRTEKARFKASTKQGKAAASERISKTNEKTQPKIFLIKKACAENDKKTKKNHGGRTRQRREGGGAVRSLEGGRKKK